MIEMTGTLTSLLSREQIQATVSRLAATIERETPHGTTLHLIAPLKGSFMFLSDLARAMSIPVTIDFVRLSSYVDRTTSSGSVNWLLSPANVRGRHVLIVEDIVDTGLTLQALRTNLLAQDPHSLRSVCLLDKPARRRLDIPIEFVGFTIDDVFVVGYGLDLAEAHRQLPFIAVIDTTKDRTSNRV